MRREKTPPKGLPGRPCRRTRRLSLAALCLAIVLSSVAIAGPGRIDRSFGNRGIAHADFGQVAGGGSPGWTMAQGRDGSLVLAGSSFVVSRHTPDGALDESFGRHGFVQVHFPASKETAARAVAAGPDGKIVVAGYADAACLRPKKGGCPRHIAVVRLNADGSLDRSFADDGLLYTRRLGMASAVAVLAHGKILVGGRGASGQFTLIRLLRDGSLDRGFGHLGTAEEGGPSFDVGTASGIALQADGKIVVAITQTRGREWLTRYTGKGAQDLSFGVDGFVHVAGTAATRFSATEGLAIQSDGKILAGVEVDRTAGLVRLLPGGTLDTTYGNDGLALGPGEFRFGSAIAVGKDGKSVLAVGTYEGVVAARFDADGALDPGFAGTGVTAPFGGGGNRVSAALGTDGGVAVAGTDWNSGDQVLTRFTGTGEPDPGFGESGVVKTTSLQDSGDESRALAIGDRRIFVAGEVNRGFGVAAFTRSGRLDRTFGTSGRATAEVLGGHPRAIAVQRNGEVVVAGEGWTGQVPDSPFSAHGFVLARFLPDGLLDSSFGEDGVVRTQYGTFGTARAVIAQRNGKLLVAGDIREVGTVARYLPDGKLDPSFGGDGIVTLRGLSTARSISVQADGRILVTGGIRRCKVEGKALSCARIDLGVVRLRPSGRLDGSFARTGAAYVPYALGIFVRESRKAIVVVGYRTACPPRSEHVSRGNCAGPVLIRRHEDGSPDRAFGRNGIAIGGHMSGVRAAAVDRHGRIFVAGANGRSFLVRSFRPNGSPIAAFGTGGTAHAKATLRPPRPAGLALQGKAGLLVAGSAIYRTGGADFTVARLHIR